MKPLDPKKKIDLAEILADLESYRIEMRFTLDQQGEYTAGQKPGRMLPRKCTRNGASYVRPPASFLGKQLC